jgi:hypothetical protein
MKIMSKCYLIMVELHYAEERTELLMSLYNIRITKLQSQRADVRVGN